MDCSATYTRVRGEAANGRAACPHCGEEAAVGTRTIRGKLRTVYLPHTPLPLVDKQERELNTAYPAADDILADIALSGATWRDGAPVLRFLCHKCGTRLDFRFNLTSPRTAVVELLNFIRRHTTDGTTRCGTSG